MSEENLTSTEENDEVHPEIDEVLDSIPEPQRKIVEKVLFSSFSMRAIESPESKALEKINESHIDKYLDGAKEEMELSYKERKSKSIFALIALVLCMIFAIAVILLLRTQPEVMEKVLYAAGGLIAGALGGYGFGKNHQE